MINKVLNEFATDTNVQAPGTAAIGGSIAGSIPGAGRTDINDEKTMINFIDYYTQIKTQTGREPSSADIEKFKAKNPTFKSATFLNDIDKFSKNPKNTNAPFKKIINDPKVKNYLTKVFPPAANTNKPNISTPPTNFTSNPSEKF